MFFFLSFFSTCKLCDSCTIAIERCFELIQYIYTYVCAVQCSGQMKEVKRESQKQIEQKLKRIYNNIRLCMCTLDTFFQKKNITTNNLLVYCIHTNVAFFPFSLIHSCTLLSRWCCCCSTIRFFVACYTFYQLQLQSV